MVNKESKKMGSRVTLYAVGLNPQQFEAEHAARLLKKENCQWRIEPYLEHGRNANNGAKMDNAASNNSGIKGT